MGKVERNTQRVAITMKSRKEMAQALQRYGLHAPGGLIRQGAKELYRAELYLNPATLKSFEDAGIPFERIEDATALGKARAATLSTENRLASRDPLVLQRRDSYLNVQEVESATSLLSELHPGLCELVTLPNITYKGHICQALRIGSRRDGSLPAVLIMGGAHAREWGSCEICLYFAADLMDCYEQGKELVWGGVRLDAARVKALLDQVEIFVFPLVNPDGRDHSMRRNPMWRKNRRPVRYGTGVDPNRNFDFLWEFKKRFAKECVGEVATSNNPRNETFCGPAPFSEAETQNVRWILDSWPSIGLFIDLHSYGELILYSWGDDENQITTPDMNFLNPAWDRARGIDRDLSYREYIPGSDLQRVVSLASAMRTSIHEVRGHWYAAQQAFDMYPTSGTSDDYAFSRHLADPSVSRVYGFTLEWGQEFQPPWDEMHQIAIEVSAGLFTFCEAALPA